MLLNNFFSYIIPFLLKKNELNNKVSRTIKQQSKSEKTMIDLQVAVSTTSPLTLFALISRRAGKSHCCLSL
ncbi:hypothetical protein BDC45DRAFT_494790, partial [Circinella umbellata]